MSEPKKIGKSFAFIFWGLFLILGYQFFDSQLARQYNPNQSPESYQTANESVLLLQQNRMGHYVTSGNINAYPVTFLLDTGATTVAVPQHIADIIGLEYGPAIRVNTANGSATAYATTIDELRIGDLRLSQLRATIMPGMKGDEILLGMSALKQVEFTQRGNQLTIRHLSN